MEGKNGSHRRQVSANQLSIKANKDFRIART